MMKFSILDLAEHEDGIEVMTIPVHVSEVDRLAGKVIRFMYQEMPGELVTGQAIEVLRAAAWWLECAAYAHYAKEKEYQPDRPTYWQQLAAGEEE
jgi:hypothetical protein